MAGCYVSVYLGRTHKGLYLCDVMFHVLFCYENVMVAVIDLMH